MDVVPFSVEVRVHEEGIGWAVLWPMNFDSVEKQTAHVPWTVYPICYSPRGHVAGVRIWFYKGKLTSEQVILGFQFFVSRRARSDEAEQ